MNAQLAPIPAPSAPAAISAHILVVDDDQAIREMPTEYLGRNATATFKPRR